MANWQYPRIRALFEALNSVICNLEGVASYLRDEIFRKGVHRSSSADTSPSYVPPSSVVERVSQRTLSGWEAELRAALERSAPTWLGRADGYWESWITLRKASQAARAAVDAAVGDLDAGIVNMLERPSHKILEALSAGERATNLRTIHGWNPFTYPLESPTEMQEAAQVLGKWFEHLRPIAERRAGAPVSQPGAGTRRVAWPLRPLRDVAQSGTFRLNFDARCGESFKYAPHGHSESTPSGTGILPQYLVYVPTERDLDALRSVFPHDDPEEPSWARVEAELIARGWTTAALRTMTPPALLRLLDATSANGIAGAHRPAVPPELARAKRPQQRKPRKRKGRAGKPQKPTPPKGPPASPSKPVAAKPAFASDPEYKRIVDQIDDRLEKPAFKRLLVDRAEAVVGIAKAYVKRRAEHQRASTRAKRSGRASGLPPDDVIRPTMAVWRKVPECDRLVLACAHLALVHDRVLSACAILDPRWNAQSVLERPVSIDVLRAMLRVVDRAVAQARASGPSAKLSPALQATMKAIAESESPPTLAQLSRQLGVPEPAVKTRISEIRRRRGKNAIIGRGRPATYAFGGAE